MPVCVQSPGQTLRNDRVTALYSQVCPGSIFKPETSRSCGEFPTSLKLSRRQLEVLTLAALGCTDKDIARQLKKPNGQPVAVRTVGAHLQKAREALGADNTTHAVYIATKAGII